MAFRTMYDSVKAADIPAMAQMVAGYVNGPVSAWAPEDWRRWPSATMVRIDVIGDAWQQASVVDCEAGDVPVSGLAAWVKARNQFVMLHGWPADATVYCSLAVWPLARAACKGLSVRWWVADWTGQPHELMAADGTAAVAVQYADPRTSGGNYDMSAVYDETWHGVVHVQAGVLVQVPSGQVKQVSSRDGGLTWK